MLEGTRNTGFWMLAALVTAPLMGGCMARTSPDTSAPSEEVVAQVGKGPTVTLPPPATAPSPVAEEQSIFRIRQPKSRVAAGTRVVIGGPAVQVTASGDHTLWIQEAGDSGRCETGNDVVAYRAIVVTTEGPVPTLARGQLVEVEGVVAESYGHRTIASAVIRPSTVMGVPYAAHCDRDGSSLSSDALDGVLVLTAGTTSGQESPAQDGTWSLAPCFGEIPSIVIGASLVPHASWSESWHWVRGVVTRRASVVRIEPRDGEDILSHRANDACL